MKNNRSLTIRCFQGTLLLYYILSPVSHFIVSASECEGGQDVFATVRENSPMGEFIANLTITGNPSANHITLSLTGADADWLFLEEKTIRLNSSITQVLDREVHGSILMAMVNCYEDGAIQVTCFATTVNNSEKDFLKSEHKITVEVLNMNDNKPEFLQRSIQPLEINELTAVNSTAFTVLAADADGDILIYGIDETSPDAGYFRVDLPNSGRVILNRSLDYETKTQLQLLLYVVEMNTKERFNSTATLTINVTDGDDQYPQFQPCTLLSLSQSSRICANPLYTVNITEHDEDIILDFSPGPILAVDGDEGLRTPLIYTILSGADNGRFVIDSNSGEVRLTRRVDNRLLTPTLRLRIMAAQTDDPLKYSVATALVRVLAENRFPPQFSRSAYRGFVSESSSPASLVNTYGNELLILDVTDRDFTDGFNPKLQFSLTSESNSSQLFYITQEGLLIAKANQLQPNHKHSLEVLATDQESGDIVKAVIDIDVLQKGLPVPQGPLEEGQPHGNGTVGRTGGVVGVCLVLLAIAVFVLVYFLKKKKQRKDPANRASVAEGKHPNVVNHSRPQPLVEEVFYHNEAFSGYDVSSSTLHGKQGLYSKTETDNLDGPSDTSNLATVTTEDSFPAVKTNGKPMDKPITKSVSFQDFVVVRECDSRMDDNRERSDSAGLEDINIDLVGTNDDGDELIMDIEGSSRQHESTIVGSEKINHEAIRISTDLEIQDTDLDKKELENFKTVPHGIPDPGPGQGDLEKMGLNIRNLDLPEPLDIKTVIMQENKPDTNQASTEVREGAVFDITPNKDASKFEVSAFSTSELDTIRPDMINADVLDIQAETPDVKPSSGEGPDMVTSELEDLNKTAVPSGTEGDHFQEGITVEGEGRAGIKIIVTVADPDDINTDSANEDSDAQDMAEKDMLHIGAVKPDSPQHHGTKQMATEEEAKKTKKDIEEAKSGCLNMHYDIEDISTNLDNEAKDETHPPALINSAINKQAPNNSDMGHVAAGSSDAHIPT